MQTDKIILGIDPGTSLTGYGLIHIKKQKMIMIQRGVINLTKLSSHELKLKKIFDRILNLIDEYKPDELAIEAPFFGKNVQSMLKLGKHKVLLCQRVYRDIRFLNMPKRLKWQSQVKVHQVNNK